MEYSKYPIATRKLRKDIPTVPRAIRAKIINTACNEPKKGQFGYIPK
jgi:hypothetical protein